MQTVRQWGNSLAIRIPAAYAKALGLREGTRVEVRERSGALVIAPRRASKRSTRDDEETHRHLEAYMRAFQRADAEVIEEWELAGIDVWPKDGESEQG